MTQQEWVLSLFPGLKSGYFVEAGAHDGVGDSQTYALEKLGWRGICVEPSNAFAGLVKHRKCEVDHRPLWRVDNAEVVFRQIAGNDVELSGIVETFADDWDRTTRPHNDLTLWTVSLPTLLREHRAPEIIQYVALDTEGSELEILKGHDWKAYWLLAVTVEHNGVPERMAALREFMAHRGYALHEPPENGIEDWFTLKA
jgi:FkbM family methyltransferase